MSKETIDDALELIAGEKLKTEAALERAREMPRHHRERRIRVDTAYYWAQALEDAADTLQSLREKL